MKEKDVRKMSSPATYVTSITNSSAEKRLIVLVVNAMQCNTYLIPESVILLLWSSTYHPRPDDRLSCVRN